MKTQRTISWPSYCITLGAAQTVSMARYLGPPVPARAYLCDSAEYLNSPLWLEDRLNDIFTPATQTQSHLIVLCTSE